MCSREKQARLEQERVRTHVAPPEQCKNQPHSTATHDDEHLLGEMVKDDASASALADKCKPRHGESAQRPRQLNLPSHV